MATIVEHRTSGGVYVLLGAGFGAYRSARPNLLLGNLMPDEQAGEMALVAVCDFNGQIGWFKSDEMRVINVDGSTPKSRLSDAPNP